MIIDETAQAQPISRRERLRVMMHDDILTAARQIVKQHGYKELSMRALAKAVGVTAPTLYDYFDSKDAVLDAMYLEGTRGLQTSFEEAIASHPDGIGQLPALGHAYRQFAQANPDLFMLIFGRIDATYRPGEQQRDSAMAMKEPVIEAVIAAIESGQMEPCDPHMASHFMWTTVHGFVMLEINEVLEKCTPAELDMMFEQTIEMIRRGLRFQ